jgi:hypothetical protein
MDASSHFEGIITKFPVPKWKGRKAGDLKTVLGHPQLYVKAVSFSCSLKFFVIHTLVASYIYLNWPLGCCKDQTYQKR